MDLTFLASPSASSVPPLPQLRGSAEAPQEAFGKTKACAAVCGLVAAAGLASSSQKRTARAGFPVGWRKDRYWPNLKQRDAGDSTTLDKNNVPAHMQPVNLIQPSLYAGAYNEVPNLIGDWKVPVPDSQKTLENMVGWDVETEAWTGKGPWDPMGFCKLFDRNFEFNSNMVYPHAHWMREAELKHGRIAMLAFVGILTKSVVTIPGYPQEMDWVKALDECYDDPTARIGIAQISGLIGVLEGKFFANDSYIGQCDREPGDLGFDPLKLSKAPGFDMKAMQLKELKNGRLAMIAVAALGAAHSIPGSVPGLGALPRTESTSSASAFCGKTAEASQAEFKTAAQYTTQKILPSLSWLKTGFTKNDIENGGLKAVTLAGNDVLVGKTEGGNLFAVGNLCPHIGTPLSEGADVIGDVIVCPLHGSSWKVTNGELIDWCVSPPIIGPLTGIVVDKKNLLIFEVREGGLLGGGELEVLVDVNAKKAFEADYWKGILDAQGKDDGSYY